MLHALFWVTHIGEENYPWPFLICAICSYKNIGGRPFKIQKDLLCIKIEVINYWNEDNNKVIISRKYEVYSIWPQTSQIPIKKPIAVLFVYKWGRVTVFWTNISNS